jgi:hypothetical protein
MPLSQALRFRAGPGRVPVSPELSRWHRGPSHDHYGPAHDLPMIVEIPNTLRNFHEKRNPERLRHVCARAPRPSPRTVLTVTTHH